MEPILLVLAAGLGLRYGGLKQLEKFGPLRRTLLQYSLQTALHHGYARAVCTVLEKNVAAMEELLRPLRTHMSIELAIQNLADGPASIPPGREKPWGTAHAVYAARHLLPSPFTIVNADDCYGEEAWEAMANVRSRCGSGAALVAYRLEKTLSPNGPVSRGVCQLAGGRLASIREFHKICRDGLGNIVDGPTGTVFSGNEPVSMNFWHLPPLFLRFLEKDGVKFFSHTAELAAGEWALPDAVGRWMAATGTPVLGLVTESPWCGVTHPEDRIWVEGFLHRPLTGDGGEL
jgi:NDP-sugar pyrophosphorylase family protein